MAIYTTELHILILVCVTLMVIQGLLDEKAKICATSLSKCLMDLDGIGAAVQTVGLMKNLYSFYLDKSTFKDEDPT